MPAFVAGLIGAALPVVVPAALAWLLGRGAQREIADSDGQLQGRGLAVTALVLAGYSVLATVGLVSSALAGS